MPAFLNSLTALSVAGIYLGWRAYMQTQIRRVCLLHERVAYMLWVTASQAE